MSDEGEEDAEEEAEQEEAPAIEESAVVEEGQASRQFLLPYFSISSFFRIFDDSSWTIDLTTQGGNKVSHKLEWIWCSSWYYYGSME